MTWLAESWVLLLLLQKMWASWSLAAPLLPLRPLAPVLPQMLPRVQLLLLSPTAEARRLLEGR
jgi:hypothetical protein